MNKNKSGQKYIEKWLSSSIANEITLSRFDFEETCEFIKNVLAITTSLPLSVRKCSVTPKETGFIIDAITALFKEGKLYIDDSGSGALILMKMRTIPGSIYPKHARSCVEAYQYFG